MFLLYLQVIECLVKLIGPGRNMVEDNGCIFLACDTILNLFLKVVSSSYIVNVTPVISCNILTFASFYW